MLMERVVFRVFFNRKCVETKQSMCLRFQMRANNTEIDTGHHSSQEVRNI